METDRVRRYKILLLISSLACLALLLLAAFEENFTAGWRASQIKFAKLLKEQAATAGGGAEAAVPFPIELRQVFLKDLNRVDRCVSCHVGIDNPAFQAAEQPLTAHPGNLLESHPVDRFGCTICHQGQGRATDKDGAHGRVAFWDEPLLVGDLVQASCAKCHAEDDVPQAPLLNRGQRLIAQLGCAGCHQFNPVVVGAKVGPPLSRIGSQVSRKWLAGWLANPKSYLPQAKMPRFDLNREAIESLSAYLMTFRDQALDDSPEPAGDAEAGTTIYREAQCIVCHVTKEDSAGNPVGGSSGPDLRKIGNKLQPRWLAVFLKNPHAFLPGTKMPRYKFNDEQAADLAQFMMEEWVDLDLKDQQAEEPEPAPDSADRIQQGKRLFQELGCVGCHDLAAGETKLAGPDLSQIGSKLVHELDFGNAKIRRTLADFLYTKLKSPRAFQRDFQLSPLKMPYFDLSDDDRLALTIALLSRRKESVLSNQYGVPRTPKATFDPQDRFGVLQRHYRCLSCHSIRGSGDRQASDLTYEGSRVRRDWLVPYLQTPYSMRRTLTIAMPIFHFSEEESRFMADYMSMVFVDTRLDAGWEQNRSRADADRGKALFDAKGCIACHQLHGQGGDVGPSLTTQVPEFPRGTWVGDKLQGGWIYHWLRNPQALVPDTLEPNLGLSEQEALDLTAFLLTLKNLDFQKEK